MKINPNVDTLLSTNYHDPLDGEHPDWLEHGIVAISSLGCAGILEGNWLACFTPDPTDSSKWHITGGSIPYFGDIMRRSARVLGTMSMERCDLYSDYHPATRLNVHARRVGIIEKTSNILAVGVGVMTAVALRRGAKTLCASAGEWALDERAAYLPEDTETGAWDPQSNFALVLHSLGYRIPSIFPPGETALEHVTLSLADLLRIEPGESAPILAEGVDPYLVSSISCLRTSLFPRVLWLPSDVSDEQRD
jgi:hypothetical protein